MDKPSMTSYEYIGGVTPKSTVEKIPYPILQVEHIVGQLIKLQNAYHAGDSNKTACQSEILTAMKTLNASLAGSIEHRRIIKP